jgi:hypothetical protein
MLLAFFSWWYGSGWKQVAGSLASRLQTVRESFSVKQLLQTLFEPWRRIVTNPGKSLEEKWHAWLDNLVSRAIGFVVRIGVLIAAGFVILAIFGLTILEIVIWPLMPLAVPALVIAGLSL